MKKARVLVGLSGGVDSAAAAAILIEKGYEVTGAVMKLYYNDSRVEDMAAETANALGIKLLVYDFSGIFKRHIIEPFIKSYHAGRTPNPCIECNSCIKFGSLFEKCIEQGYDFLATGHYANTEYCNGRYLLKKPVEKKKDQTYFLYRLNRQRLFRILFPLGSYTKEQARDITHSMNIPASKRKDSQEICFVADRSYSSFINTESGFEAKPGYFVDKKGNVLGRHKGIINYTVGQRKGLGISKGERIYVTGLVPERNEVVLGRKDDTLSDNLTASNLRFIPFDTLCESMKVTAKIRYNAKEADAEIIPLDNGRRVKAVFKKPQMAITPGQSVVFYSGDLVIGGGVIESQQT